MRGAGGRGPGLTEVPAGGHGDPGPTAQNLSVRSVRLNVQTLKRQSPPAISPVKKPAAIAGLNEAGTLRVRARARVTPHVCFSEPGTSVSLSNPGFVLTTEEDAF